MDKQIIFPEGEPSYIDRKENKFWFDDDINLVYVKDKDGKRFLRRTDTTERLVYVIDVDTVRT